MRILLCALLVLQSSLLCFGAKLPPLTVKDVSLMLRTGYTVQAVERELQTRHLCSGVIAALGDDAVSVKICCLGLP